MKVGKIDDLTGFLKETFNQWQSDKATRMGAALAYYTIFSLPPLMIVSISLAGYFFGRDAAEGQLVNQIQGLLGHDGAVQIQEMIKNAHNSGSGTIASIIGIVMLLVGASGVFAEIQDSLNSVWGVAPNPDRSWMKVIKERLGSFTMVAGSGFLLMVSLIVDTVLTAFTNYLSNMFSSSLMLLLIKVANVTVSFIIITLMFAMVYKVLPDVKLSIRDVGLGAVVTAALFTIGKVLIGLYLGHSNIGATYGAAGSIIVMLVWIFYASLIFLFGAEFTQVYVRKYGAEIVPIHGASIVDPKKCKAESIKKDTKDSEFDKKDKLRAADKQKKLALIPINGSAQDNLGKQKNIVAQKKKSSAGILFNVIFKMVISHYRKPSGQKRI